MGNEKPEQAHHPSNQILKAPQNPSRKRRLCKTLTCLNNDVCIAQWDICNTITRRPHQTRSRKHQKDPRGNVDSTKHSQVHPTTCEQQKGRQDTRSRTPPLQPDAETPQRLSGKRGLYKRFTYLINDVSIAQWETRN